MEIKTYLLLLRKWAWLLILGAVIGGGAAYYFSSRQPEVYQTTSRVMVSRAPEGTGADSYYVYNDIQLAGTYAQLVPSQPVLERASAVLGYEIRSSQIKVEQVSGSMILLITVSDSEAERAAQIANSVIDVFIEYNDTLQKSRYADSETSLQDQIDQVEAQIASLQAEMTQVSEQSEETLRQQQEEEFENRLDELKGQLDSTENEIIQLESAIAAMYPVPIPTATPVNRWATLDTPVPTATFTPQEQVELKELENQLDQQQTLRKLYKDTYASLLVIGGGDNSASSNSNSMRQNQLQTTLALYQQIYTNLLNNYEAVRLARLRSTPNVVQIEPALAPTHPIQPQPLRNLMLGAISGLMIMGAIAFLVEYLDDTIKTPEDVHRHLEIPVIGFIGEMSKPKGWRKGDEISGVYVAENPLSPITESFRTLRTNLEFAGVDSPLKTILVTSSGPSEGKTTLAVNLSAIIAQGDKKVLLIDTDLRRPAVHRYLGIANRKGLSDLFRSNVPVQYVIDAWGNPQVAVITSGGLPPNPTELLSSEKMTRMLNDLKSMVDVIILDGPPAIVADPIVLAAKVDGVVIVIEPGKTKIGQSQVLMEQMQRAGARVVGAVLNPISKRRAHYYSKYRYYSAYYYSSRGYGGYFSDNGATNGKQKPEKKAQEKISSPAPD